jgi:hypothetical protein
MKIVHTYCLYKCPFSLFLSCLLALCSQFTSIQYPVQQYNDTIVLDKDNEDQGSQYAAFAAAASVYQPHTACNRLRAQQLDYRTVR